MIKKYNKIVTDIVSHFCKRYWKEIYKEEIQNADYKYSIDIMEYQWVALWPINISDDYYDLNDIILAEHLQIPCEIVREYNNRMLERNMDWKERDCNLYYFWQNRDSIILKDENEADK